MRNEVSETRGGHNRAFLLAGIMLCLLLQAWLALVLEINWDEFFYLSNLYAYERGELTKALQSFQVHLLACLTAIPGDEIAQVEAGRFVMLACEAATCGFIHALARTFFKPLPSLIAVLGYVSAGFTILHGASFRADPLTAALLMAALALLARGRMTVASALGIALCVAVALLVTIKAVFFVPAFAALAMWRVHSAQRWQTAVRWLGATAAAAATLLVSLYALQLLILPNASSGGTQSILGNAGRTTITEAGFLPRARELVQWMILSPLQTALLLLGAGFALRAAFWRSENRPAALVALAGAMPLLSLLFYRNAFPYFFAFILPPATLLMAWFVEGIPNLRRYAPLIALAFVAPAVVTAYIWSRHGQSGQRQVVSAVHRIFARPVAYIDRNGMIASFPKRGFFMSTWGMENYARRAPVFTEVLRSDTVPLLIINTPAFQNALLNRPVPPTAILHPEDRAVLRDNFIPHWGLVWVAGKHVSASPRPSTITVAIPGLYTVESADAEIDGRLVATSGTVSLGRGKHIVRSPIPALVTLRWGNHLYRPTDPPILPIYRGF